MPQPPNLILLGSMGSGKTSSGKELAALTGFEFFDMDRWIEEKTGKKVAEIFEEEGEAQFRNLERKAVEHLREKRRQVVSLGGGAWMDEGNRVILLENGWCVWLRVSPQEAWKRVQTQKELRPLLARSKDPQKELERVIRERSDLYSKAHFQVNTDGKSPKEVAGIIIQALKKEAPFDLSILQN